MEINIITFGSITDITAENSFTISGVTDTNQLIRELNRLYPPLLRSKYVLAVNEILVTENTLLTDKSTVAILPPFSGG
ncbi:MAG: hypothetical protein NVSMB63_09670 [Sediminibacterium sp.]